MEKISLNLKSGRAASPQENLFWQCCFSLFWSFLFYGFNWWKARLAQENQFLRKIFLYTNQFFCPKLRFSLISPPPRSFWKATLFPLSRKVSAVVKAMASLMSLRCSGRCFFHFSNQKHVSYYKLPFFGTRTSDRSSALCFQVESKMEFPNLKL